MRVVHRVFMAAALAATTITLGAQGNSQAAKGIDTSLEGTLEVLIEDSARSSKVHHFLYVDDGNGKSKKIKLQFTDEAPALTTGSKIKVRGNLTENTLELSSQGGSVQTQQLASPNTFGEQKVAVILINFQDNASVPYGWSEASTVTFQTVSDFFRESTYGKTWLTGDVFGWFTLPMSSASCDYNQMSNLADQAATASGVNLSQFTSRALRRDRGRRPPPARRSGPASHEDGAAPAAPGRRHPRRRAHRRRDRLPSRAQRSRPSRSTSRSSSRARPWGAASPIPPPIRRTGSTCPRRR